LVERLRKAWTGIRDGAPGRRFQDRWRSRQEGGRSPLRKALWIGSGGALVAAGVILLMIPGPGIPVLALGGALLAQESRRIARLLDTGEVKIRGLLRR
jgi:hypothetical protein